MNVKYMLLFTAVVIVFTCISIIVRNFVRLSDERIDMKDVDLQDYILKLCIPIYNDVYHTSRESMMARLLIKQMVFHPRDPKQGKATITDPDLIEKIWTDISCDLSKSSPSMLQSSPMANLYLTFHDDVVIPATITLCVDGDNVCNPRSDLKAVSIDLMSMDQNKFKLKNIISSNLNDLEYAHDGNIRIMFICDEGAALSVGTAFSHNRWSSSSGLDRGSVSNTSLKNLIEWHEQLVLTKRVTNRNAEIRVYGHVFK